MKDLRRMMRNIDVPDMVQEKVQDVLVQIREKSRMNKKNNDYFRAKRDFLRVGQR